MPEKRSQRVREYAFDVKLFAVIRVNAPSRVAALQAAEKAIDCISLLEVQLDDPDVKITETSFSADDSDPILFEIDGNEVDP